MPATWPSQLQQELNENSFAFELGETTLRTENQQGPAKVRRLMTKSVDKITGTINITRTQYAIFLHFFDTTLNGGAGTFNFNHPISGEVTEFRFTGPPTFSYLGGEMFRAAFSWETIPS